jgi:Flp pilus assembly protein TadD/4-amino-4-deoxy-L-arabinose transferase-like glycosyltransferase
MRKLLPATDISAAAFRTGLVFLFLLGLIVRIGYAVEHAHHPAFGVPVLDQRYYDTVARMLLAGEDLRQLHGFRPLLYPLFLAVCYKLGGSWGIDLALLVQHVLGIATGLLVALLGARLFRHRLCGLAGGALFLLAPVPLCFEGELLIEPLYTFLIVLALWLHLVSAERPGWKGGALWLLGGGLIVLTAQARANILVFLAIYPLFAVRRWRQTRQPTAFWPLCGLAGGLAMAIPWGVVNMKQTDAFHLMPGAGGVNLYLGNKRTADGMVPEQERRVTYGDRYEDSVEVWAREEYETALRAQGRQPDADPAAISEYWTRRALDEIRTAPAAWVKLMGKKGLLTCWNTEIPNNKAFAFLRSESLWLRVLPVRWVVLLMLAPAGIWLAMRHGARDGLFILITFAVLYFGANILFFVCDRFRYPVWPAMAVLGGGGCWACFDAWRRRDGRQIVCLAAAMGLMAALSLPNWSGARLPTFARDHLFRSMAWYGKGCFQEALSDIDCSVRLDPSDATALQHRGNVLFALGRMEEAGRAYDEALKRSPGEAGIWNNLGAVHETLGHTNEAIAALRRATECRPPSKKAFVGMACIQIRSGRIDEAIATLDRFNLLERKPDPVALALRAVIARRQGNDLLARELEHQARTLDPDATAWALRRVTSPNP